MSLIKYDDGITAIYGGVGSFLFVFIMFGYYFNIPPVLLLSLEVIFVAIPIIYCIDSIKNVKPLLKDFEPINSIFFSASIVFLCWSVIYYCVIFHPLLSECRDTILKLKL